MSQPVEPEPQPSRLREIFGRWFWVNYAVCVLATVWIPLVTMQAEVDGKLQGAPRYVPMHEIYWNLTQHPEYPTYWGLAAMHLGITFVIMAGVWAIVLRRRGPAA